ncbi:MAG TPA: SMEK domain-containing protein, partial [Candidatus Obscuribacterales bacterium]
MIYREQVQKKIIYTLSILEVSIKHRGLVNLYDQNIFAETFIAKILNIVFDYNLVNLNHQERGKTGIDLGDWTRKIAFQVTSTKDSRKIKETINKFINHEQYIYFNHLKFFILNQKQKSYSSKIETEGKFNFNPNVDIIDIQDVIKMVDSLPIEKMEQI